MLDGFLSAVFTGLRDKDIIALPPQRLSLGNPLIFPKAGHGNLSAASNSFIRSFVPSAGAAFFASSP